MDSQGGPPTAGRSETSPQSVNILGKQSAQLAQYAETLPCGAPEAHSAQHQRQIRGAPDVFIFRVKKAHMQIQTPLSCALASAATDWGSTTRNR